MNSPSPEGSTVVDLSATAVVVVNFGSYELLLQNLGPVSDELPEVTVVVVDNFTDEHEQLRVAELCDRRGWRAVLLSRNTGFGEGVNAGVEDALEQGATSVLVLNPDASIRRESVERLALGVAHDPDAMIAPEIRRSNGRLWFGGSDVYLDDGRMGNPRQRAEKPSRRYREWISGACFMMSADLWRRTGGFDPDYFLYWEDVDLSARVVDAGGRLVVDSEASAVHDSESTHTDATAGRAKSETYYYYNIRNRLVYGAKHLGDDDLGRWLRATPRVAYEILLQGGRRQFLRPVKPLRAFVRGIRDGRRFVARTRGRRRPG